MANTEGGELRLFSGPASAELAAKVAAELGVSACMPCTEFPGGEVFSTLPDSIRGDDVFVLQSHCMYQRFEPEPGQMERRSPQDAFMDHLFMINAAHSSWAGRVIAVAPHLGYVRQDRRTGRQSISAALTADMLKLAGADGVMAIDLHSAQAEGFFRGPYEHLAAAPTFVNYVHNTFDDQRLVVVSPDSGRFKSSDRLRDALGPQHGLAVVDGKTRNKDGTVQAGNIIGDSVKGQYCLLNDDMIDGAGTIVKAAEITAEAGAAHTTVIATHGIFSRNAAARLANSAIDRLVVTDTIPLPPDIAKLKHPEIVVVSIASFLAKAIEIVHEGGSVQELHGNMPQRI
jgi:ribose-phosphate pyrophosphokinase